MDYQSLLKADGMLAGRAILREREGGVFRFTDATFVADVHGKRLFVIVTRPESAPIYLYDCRVLYSEHGALELFVESHNVIDALVE